ncbi:hypothetical protein LAT59_02325 [Candidatus Gracilibacteria bacterium]|nr:hypothetical protein [Candidatus Gracilibacteria bacterium]
MFKKIFLLFLALLFIAGGYFYVFPIYPDYGISEEYFHTRFHEEGFDSPQNGFHAWKELIECLDEYTGLIGEFDIYYKCFLEDDCSYIDQNLTSQEKVIYLELILNDTDKMSEFGDFIQNFTSTLEYISSSYSYISTLNYHGSDDLGIAIGSEMIFNQQLRAFTRGILFYMYYSSNSEASSIFISYYKYLSWLSQNLDDNVVGYLVLIEILDMLFDFLTSYYDKFSPAFQGHIQRVISDFYITEGMMINGVKSEHQYKLLLYQGIEDGALDGGDNSWGFNPKTFLFYDILDTLNLARKIDKNTIEGNCDFEIQINGRNFIGRTLLEMNHCFLLDRHFQKEADLLEKRLEIIDLLTN